MGKSEGARGDGKKLSWSYRNKKRQGKTRKPENTDDANVQVQNKKARIVVRNLDFKATEEDVRRLYVPFGEIEQIDLLRRPDGKLVGCGFVQFKRIPDASKAIFQTNKHEFLGRKLGVAWAVPKSKFVQQLNKKLTQTSESEEKPEEEKSSEEETESSTVKEEDDEEKTDKKPRRERKKATQEERKLQKIQKRKKRARIVVRNLPFKITEKILKKHFAEYGNIEEVKLLTRPDGKRVGCGFVQFERVQSARQAIKYSNMKPLLNRQIVVDPAIPKAQFAAAADEVEVKEEKPDVEVLDGEVKTDPDQNSTEEDNEVSSVKSESSDDDDEEENSASDSETDDEDEEVEEEKPVVKSELDKRPRVFSHDVSEGKTVFIKNVPFSVDNEELKACMQQFGPVYYALVCVDKLTEHSKGTAFVKFRNLEDAEKCLAAGTELQLHGQVLDPHRAVDRKELQQSKSQTSNQKDSRNLYLVKEGVILAGSPAAADVSAADMAKRLQMEQWKSQMLRNLNMFVSRVRLVVHNLPPTLDDAKLRQIFKNHAGSKAVITEARVMRDLKNPDASGVGQSKGFGFVAFTSHEDALRALRSINNNPNVFSKTRRPIVAFSIENRVMVNAKQRRVQKSRDNNPLWKGKRSQSPDNDSSPPAKRKKSESSDRQNSHKPTTVNSHIKSKKSSLPKDEETPEFSGVTSKPGVSKLRSKFNLKTQAQLHKNVQKNEKKQKKLQRKIKEKKINQQIARKEVKPKQGAKKLSREDANLERLVENYRSKLSAVPKRSKWFDT